MNKRQRKKIHKNYLFDIICDISQDEYWRELLFNSIPETIFRIDQKSLGKLPNYLISIVRKNRLRYNVSKLKEKVGEDIVFRFQADDFQEIRGYSENNSNYI